MEVEMSEVYLAHHGVIGMKWGVRRYQDKNGNLTSAGKKKYFVDNQGNIKKIKRKNLKNFDYKKDDFYKRASKVEQKRLRDQYDKDEMWLGETAAKKLYLTDIRGGNHNLSAGKQFVQQVGTGILVGDLLTGGALTKKAIRGGVNAGRFTVGSVKKTIAGNAARKAARDAVPKLSAKKLVKVAKNVYEYR